jgi:uridine kinase
MDTRPVIELIDAAVAERGGGLVLVGIGGRGAAGKTSLARVVPGAQIVSTDEFWDGGGFDIPRLEREVVATLAAGRPARFSSYDWTARRVRGERVVEPRGVVIVEGVCALHRTLRDAYAVRVWVEAPAELRLARGVARDGEDARRTWVDVWMPSEDRYVERDDPVACADIVVDGAGAPPAATVEAPAAS